MSRINENIFTPFDVMERKGVFSGNPANSYAYDRQTKESIYKGPVPYPKMLYHPKGELRKTSEGEAIATPFGPKVVGEQWELIWTIANNKAEDVILRAEGWHDQPWKANKAAGRDVSKIEAQAKQKAAQALAGVDDGYLRALEDRMKSAGIEQDKIDEIMNEVRRDAKAGVDAPALSTADLREPDPGTRAIANAFLPTEALIERNVGTKAKPDLKAAGLID